MNKFERLEAVFDVMYQEAVEMIKLNSKAYETRMQTLLYNVKKDIEEYNATGIIPMDGFDSPKATNELISNSNENARGRVTSVRASSAKENNSELANHIEPQTSIRVTRSNKISTVKVCDKVLVKMERITENFNTTLETDLSNISKTIKREMIEMPPPAQLPAKRTRGRKPKVPSSSSNIAMNDIVVKHELIESDTKLTSARESDVVIQVNKVLNITIDDSDEENQPLKTRPTRTRTKRIRLSTAEAITSEASETDQKTKQQKFSEKPNMNVTVVLSKDKSVANSTFVVHKNTFTEQEKQLLTDDEDVIDNSIKETRAHKKKQIFNPYAESPVKNRVAAFEKLGASVDNQTRTTRANARKIDKNIGSEENQHSPTSLKKGGLVLKSRTTPAQNKILTSSTNMSQQQNTPSAIPLPKSRSALKASQAEFRARELKRQQNEREAQAKKEALINAQMEEKRRRNEERQLKAQQHRDALEKEKQQLLEVAENAKLSKMKQLLAEKEEKHLKLKEDANKKRQQALKKAASEKRKLETKNGLPLLPTADCYDSDDATGDKKRPEKPIWQNTRSLYIIQKRMSNIGQIKKKLFSCAPQYPDECLIFPGSKPVTRNSSVIWDTSNMSMLHSMIQEDEL